MAPPPHNYYRSMFTFTKTTQIFEIKKKSPELKTKIKYYRSFTIGQECYIIDLPTQSFDSQYEASYYNQKLCLA
jgi:hypothetical protein